MSQSTPIPEWMLERYLLGELPRRERLRVEAELERDPALRAELEKLRESDRQILAAYPVEQAAAQIMKKADLARPRPAAAAASRRRRLAWTAVPALALAALLLLVLPPYLKQRLAGPGEYTGVKGGATGPALQVFRSGGGGDMPLRDGATARAGDLLQLAYLPGRETHGVILSIDGSGGVTLHFPEREDGDTALRAGGRTLLPRAFELDRAPRFERFFFVTASAPLPTAEILVQARRLAADPQRSPAGRLDLPGRFRQFSFLVRKRSR